MAYSWKAYVTGNVIGTIRFRLGAHFPRNYQKTDFFEVGHKLPNLQYWKSKFGNQQHVIRMGELALFMRSEARTGTASPL